MSRTRKALAAFWMVGWSLVSWAGELREQNSQVTVFVTDGAAATDSLVVEAERNVTRVFHQAGIELDWVNCGGSADQDARCDGENITGNLVVHIVPRAHTLPPGVFGVSFLAHDAGAYADVFFDPIERLREVRKEISLAEILGYVMAHELGHLLLGSNAHSPDGIMQAHWESEQLRSVTMGQLRFTPAQAAKMRSRIASLQKTAEESLVLAVANR